MMLPQFGFIVAQAGADSTPPTVPQSQVSITNNNNNIASLPPLLNTKTFQYQSSLNMDYYNNYTNTYYSRQSTPTLPHPYAYSSLPTPPIPSIPHPLSPTLKYSRYSPLLEDKKETWYPYEEEEWEETPHPNDDCMKEHNDLMTWMDNEYWERADQIYQDKLHELQNELISLQEGTHTVFTERIADIESVRDTSIHQADCLYQYEISVIDHSYQDELNSLEEEYETDKKALQESIIHSIQNRRKQVNDQNENQDEYNTRTKRNLRKRTSDAVAKNEPPSKRRSHRPNALLTINTASAIKEDELESDLVNMRKPLKSISR